MKSFVLLGLLVTVVSAHPLENSLSTPNEELDSSSSSNRIINGATATAGQFPHQVLNFNVVAGGTYLCGGSLICKSWVLTAAHCASGVSNFTLYFGSLDRVLSNETGRVVVTTTSATIHPQYVAQSYSNDIALINLGTNLSFTDRIQPIPLKTSSVPAGVELTISGWGKTSDVSGYSRYLKYTTVESISKRECNIRFNTSLVTDSMMCCSGTPNHSSCTGDSGGPLIQYTNNSAVLVGVITFVARNACTRALPSGYARISHYIGWIESTIGNSCSISKV